MLRVLFSLCLGLLLPLVAQGIEPPPVGPPWSRELAAAQKIALEQGTPIFVYFTKTHCPHCVPVEKDVLPSEKLKPAYKQVAWLFNNRSFDGSPRDRIAENIEHRFGVSSYPHLLLIDPEKLTVITEMGRSEEELLTAFRTIKVQITDAKAAAAKLKAAELTAAKLRSSQSLKDARELIGDSDIVVRLTALEVLAKKEPKTLLPRVEELLKVEHDPFRFELLNTLATSGDSSAAPALAALLESPYGSLNPNVLRIMSVKALAKCGTAESVPTIAKFASTGEYNNSLTGQSIATLQALALRLPQTKASVKAALLESYPAIPAAPEKNEQARCIALAKTVHLALSQVTNKQVAFPSTYNEATRQDLKQSW